MSTGLFAVEKLRDIPGPYLDPPEHAVALSRSLWAVTVLLRGNKVGNPVFGATLNDLSVRFPRKGCLLRHTDPSICPESCRFRLLPVLPIAVPRKSWYTGFVERRDSNGNKMRNITVALPEDVARWVRVWAARHNTSVSRLLGRLLEEKMAREDEYGRAAERFLSKRPRRLRTAPSPYPKRESLHER